MASICWTGWRIYYFILITNPTCCNRNINVCLVIMIYSTGWFITSLQSKYTLNGILCLRGTAFGIFINFVNIRGLDLPQNIDKGICSRTLPNKMWKIMEATVKRDGKVWILQAYFAHVIILLEQVYCQVQGIRFAATNRLPITNGSYTNFTFFGVRHFELLLSSTLPLCPIYFLLV